MFLNSGIFPEQLHCYFKMQRDICIENQKKIHSIFTCGLNQDFTTKHLSQKTLNSQSDKTQLPIILVFQSDKHLCELLQIYNLEVSTTATQRLMPILEMLRDYDLGVQTISCEDLILTGSSLLSEKRSTASSLDTIR